MRHRIELGGDPFEDVGDAIDDHLHQAAECFMGGRVRSLRGCRESGRRLESHRHEVRSEEHTSELQSPYDLVCRLLLEKKNTHEKHSVPVYDAARPRPSTTPTCRCTASLSPFTRLVTTSFGAIPRFSIATPSRPYTHIA